MTRTNIALIAAVVFLSGALVLAASLPANPQSQNPPRSTLKPNETSPNGRYQITNGTPELSRNIMLLDTQTGQTWIVCDGPGGTAWRIMNVGVQVGKALLGKPSEASEGATMEFEGVKYVSKDGKWQLP